MSINVPSKKWVEKICINPKCSKAFIGHYNAKYCERRCAKQVEYVRDRDKILERSSKHYYEKLAKQPPKSSKFCESCKVDISHKREGTMFCGKKCQQASWYTNNKEHCAELMSANYQKNTDRYKHRAKTWAGNNRDRRREHEFQRQSRLINAPDPKPYTDWQWGKAVNRLGGVCYYCGVRFDEQETPTRDHVQALLSPVVDSEGKHMPWGRHAEGNIVPACFSCNSSKKNTMLVRWAKRPINDWSRRIKVMLSNINLKKKIDSGHLLVESMAPGAIQPNSIDLHLSDTFLVWDLDKTTEIDPSEVDPDMKEVKGEFTLAPQSMALASTVELIGIDNTISAKVEGKSSLGRLGLAIHLTAGFVDSGFHGHLTLELFNFAPVPFKLTPGMKIAQLSVFELDDPTDTPYGTVNNRYQGQEGPTSSLMNKRWKLHPKFARSV